MLAIFINNFKNLTKRFLQVCLVLGVFFVIIKLFISFSTGQKTEIRSNDEFIKAQREKIYERINVKKKLTTDEKINLAMYRLFMCGTVGETCADNPNDKNNDFKKSLFGGISNLIAAPYANPPASGIYYAYDSVQNSGLVPQAYAAEGIGFGSIKAFIQLWKAFRDVAYLIIVLITVAIGFMIMFRVKLNPQTIIGIENALPKIIITILLITFSCPIAGFLIDLMYLMIAIVISIIGKAGGLNITQVTNDVLQASPGSLLFQIVGGGQFWVIGIINIFLTPFKLSFLLGPILGGLLQGIGTTIIAFVWGIPISFYIFEKYIDHFTPTLEMGVGFSWEIIDALFGDPLALTLALVFGGIIAFVLLNLILGLLMLLTLMFVFFRILALLISAYIKILLLTIFSPIILLGNAIPGQNTFESWLRNLLVELVTFPVVIAIIMIGSLILNIISAPHHQVFTPPFLANISADVFAFLVGMGILFLIPDLVTVFKQLVLPKPIPFPPAGPGVFFGGATSGLKAGVSSVSPYLTFAHYVGPVKSLLGKFGIKIS